MTDRTDLPDTLLDQMGGKTNDTRPYTSHDLVLSYVAAHPGGSTANDLLVYLWESTSKVTTRGYLYHILSRLRKAGVVLTRNPRSPVDAMHYATLQGANQARPYLEVSDE